MDPITLAALGAVAFSETVKFLYGQASELLQARRDRKQAALQADTPIELAVPASAPLDARPATLVADASSLDALHPQLAELGMELAPYALESAEIGSDPGRLERAASELRALLEEIYGRRLTFAGEDRTPTGTRLDVRQEFESVSGVLRGVDADEIGQGAEVNVEQRGKDLHGGGTVEGVRAKTIGGR